MSRVFSGIFLGKMGFGLHSEEGRYGWPLLLSLLVTFELQNHELIEEGFWMKKEL